MNIDWDEVVEEADATPRSLLAEVLGLADEIDELVIIVKDKENVQREWWCASEASRVIMLELSKFNALKEMNSRIDGC